jgi:hypothetical protein
MRRLVLALTVLVCLGGAAGADEIWLKDGRRIVTAKPLVAKGTLAYLTTVDGVLLSIPLSEIDLDKTASEKARIAAATPVPTPGVVKPLTPAQAAKQTSSRRAAVVLTDETIAHGIGDEFVEKKEGEGEGRVDIANTSVSRTKDGYAFSGTVINGGTNDVSGVAVTVEIVGKDGKTFSSAFAQVAKDTLAPGEKSTFTASAPLEGEAASYHYLPHWQVRLPVKTSADAGSGSGASKAAGGGAEPESTPPAPSPTPVPAPTYIPRADVAPPPASAPTGNPANGTFIPQNDSPTPAPPPAPAPKPPAT